MSISLAKTPRTPHITSLDPQAALPGGEVRIRGTRLLSAEAERPYVEFGATPGAVLISSDDLVVARVPDGVINGAVAVGTNGNRSNTMPLAVGVTIAESLHLVTSPAVDHDGNIYATFSGSRGNKVPVALFKIDTNYSVTPFVEDMMNATAVAFDRAGLMYVSSRFDGAVYRVQPNGTVSTFAESLGVATGLAFDSDGNLYVGDRSGTIFKISPDRQIFVFATLEPSVSAYHLAFDSHGNLYVTGPTTSSFEVVHRIDPHGVVSVFYRGLGRPQGLAFDSQDNLYVAASLKGRSGIIRITPGGEASLAVAAQGSVGLAFAPSGAAVIATTNAVHYLAWDTSGLPLI